MRRKSTRWLTGISGMIFVTAFALWLFSPYRNYGGFRYKLVKYTVQINAPADSVFRFLGNSANASRWSVFVDHILTLNPDEVPDGQIGSRRRCFRKADEKGLQWDEVITHLEPGRRRQIRCYNLVDFPVASEGLATEQRFKEIAPDKCELTFTVFYLDKKPSWLDVLKIRFSAYSIRHIFSQNMNNIKRVLETGE